MKKHVLIATVVIFLYQAFVAQAENLVVMGWDGVGRSEINILMADGKLPNLSGLTLAETENITATFTVPGWTQVFTGQTYDQSRVLGNIEWDTIIPFSETVPGRLKESKNMKIGWYASKRLWSKNCGITPLCEIAVNSDNYSYHEPVVEGNRYLQNMLGDAQRFALQNLNNDIFVALLCNPDVYGHIYGSGSTEYYNEIVRCDKALGSLIAFLQGYGIYDKTKIIVVSDHGFDPMSTTHYNAPYSFIGTNLPILRRGTLRDVANTMLDYFQIDPAVQEPYLRGNSLLEPESMWRK